MYEITLTGHESPFGTGMVVMICFLLFFLGVAMGILFISHAERKDRKEEQRARDIALQRLAALWVDLESEARKNKKAADNAVQMAHIMQLLEPDKKRLEFFIEEEWRSRGATKTLTK